jgi:UPF0755 protein
MKKIFKFIVILILVLVAIVLTAYYYIHSKLEKNIPVESDVIVMIPKGTNLDGCVEIMNYEGLFEPGWFYELIVPGYSKLYDANVIAGSYKFSPEMKNRDVLSSIFNGKNLYIIRVTYPEGITLEKFAEITEKKLKIRRNTFLNVVNSEEILEERGIDNETAEGYLMPDTYEFFFNPDVKIVINKLFDHQDKLWKRKFADKSISMGWTRHQVLTLASIIEAETPIVDERARVSGVYHNRLKAGMLLQADPTIQFIMGGKQRILHRDLEVNNPYNTYKFKGLPPGPINSPSESSIKAALNPEQHDYYYFVAQGDGSGRHNFARTYNEHLAFVAIYRRNLRSN